MGAWPLGSRQQGRPGRLDRITVEDEEMRLPLLLGIAAVGLLPAFASAQEPAYFQMKTTQDLYAVCSLPANDPLYPEAINFCQGYLLAAVHYDYAVSDRKHLQRFVCPPEGVTRTQGIQAFVEWAAGHQQDHKFMDDPPVYGAVRGLAHKWPCKQS
jgi:hypothetical protein